MSAPLEVLFVCTANSCRSPFLERYATLRNQNPDIRFTSAGTHGWVDQPMSPDIAEALRGRGGQPDGFRSRRLTLEMVEHADLVLTAERTHRRFVLDDSPEAFRKVLTLGQALRASAKIGRPDPDTLLADIASHRGMAEPADDVADPYGLGRSAAYAAAEAMAAMLDQFLAVLPAGAAGHREDRG
jgi:sulfate adenylyltransferase